MNEMAKDFNKGLESIIAQLNAQLTGANVLYADTFTPVMDYVNNPHKYGKHEILKNWKNHQNTPKMLGIVMIIF